MLSCLLNAVPFVALTRRDIFGPLLTLALCVAVLAFSPGCAFKGDFANGDKGMSEAWVAAPLVVRILPTSRFVREERQPICEVNIEFVDEMGDPLKAAGILRFELFQREPDAPDQLGKRLYRWDIDLLTLEDQRDHYSAVLRGYRFRLRMESLEVRQVETSLRVSVELTDGRRLVDVMEVDEDWRGG